MAAASTQLEVPITGMTCASCANRIERKLNKLDGVNATVNFATEIATAQLDPAAASPEQIIKAITAAGYGATIPDRDQPREEQSGLNRTMRRRCVGG